MKRTSDLSGSIRLQENAGDGAGQRFANGLRALGLALLLWVVAAPLCAQVATGDILGTVSDASGAVVPGASVKVENVGTHEVRQATTKGVGEYVFSALQPGTYTVTVSSSNFKTFSTSNVVVLASDRIRIDARLQTGTVDQRVEVEATPSALQTDSTTVGSTITEKTLEDAPLNGRNYFSLVQLQAGVNGGSATSFGSGQNLTDRRLTSAISANGQQEFYNNNLVDGLDNNERAAGLVMLRPSVEAIAAVRTDINLYNAEVGRTGGAVINVITKSGANQLHGSVYEFFRNDYTDARNFFATTALLSHKPELRQNQFGGSLSGPIFHDKTFFFVDYEGLRRIDGNNSVFINTVPTVAEQTTPGFLGDILNPFLSRPGAPVTVPNIPAASIDPTALAYLKLFPMPNQFGPSTAAVAGGLTGVVNNFLYNPTSSFYSNQGDVRIDHHFSQKDTLFARYSYNRNIAFNPPAFPTVNGVGTSGTLQGVGANNIYVHNGQLSYTHIFSSSLLMELKAGYDYSNIFASPINYGKNLNDQAPYKIPNANECDVCSGLATINVIGFAPLGDSLASPGYLIDHNTQFAGTVTYTRGRQTIKIGGSLIRRNFTFRGNIYAKGFFNFAPTVVLPSAANPAGVYQASLQHFLLGAPFISARSLTTVRPYDRVWEPSGFFQDDWRVTDHLTVNLGVRYDTFTKPNEKNGNSSNFDLTSLSIIQNATGGLQTAHNDISPRLGFAATFGHGTVLRGGFGLSFFPGESNSSLVLANPPLGFTTGNVINFTPISTTGVAPVTTPSTATASLFGSLFSEPLHQPDNYIEQFNLLFQQGYRGTVFTLGYVGALGRHLTDQVPNLDIPAPNGPYPNNVAGPVPAVRFAAQLPRVTTINYYGDFGSSSYNSIQTSVERRISHGLTANFNYTYSHNLDDLIEVFDGDTQSVYGFGDLPSQIGSYDYGNSPLDLRQRFAGFFSYDLPFGKGGSHFSKAVLGGFRFNGLGFWQTGSAFTITSSVTNANNVATINLPTVTIDRPNLVAPVVKTGSLNQFFSVSSFAQQPYGTVGNERRNQLFGPNLRRGDLSLFKTVPILEHAELELRAECINFTNTPNFAKPGSTITAYSAGSTVPSQAGGFGQINSTLFGYSGRQFQFAARVHF